MKINRNNYEAFFIDYLEGNLDEMLVDDFIEFLQQNPDKKEELSLFEIVSIGQEEITFNKKENLFKEKYDAENEFNQAAIARLEGDIPESEITEFENYLSAHPEKQKEAELFNKTKLQPDESILFAAKNKLYRRAAGKTILLWASRAAAILVIALSIYIYIDKSSDKIISETQLAAIENEPERKGNIPVNKETPVIKGKNAEQINLKEETVNPVLKKKETKPNSTIINRNNSHGRLINDNMASVRISDEIISELQSLTPVVYAAISKTDLMPVLPIIPETNETIDDERLLVDVFKEKTGFDKLTLNKIAKAGLSLVANLSKEKFNYQTNTEGKVTEVSFDSRLLAFSIPTGSAEEE